MNNQQKNGKGFDVVEAGRIAMFVGGISLISYGFWRVFEPMGYIVAGVTLFATAMVGAVRAGSRS
ncbi:MAG TPA: hypothetical protein VJ654_14095 [Noviherbaspirillum sp.]|nr:hypothetical protein [Noviherbaspirillum sp.]